MAKEKVVWVGDDDKNYDHEIDALRADAEHWRAQALKWQNRAEENAATIATLNRDASRRRQSSSDDENCSGPGGGQGRNHP